MEAVKEGKHVRRIGQVIKTALELMKLRLSFFVVISSVFGYAMAIGIAYLSFMDVFVLSLSGILVTGAANAINQILEKDFDIKMSRTKGRPLPTGRMQVSEAVLWTLTWMLTGLFLIGFYFNLVAALLSFISLLLYGFVYTPMKRWSRVNVLVGAIPGALPPLIGWAAYHGSIDQYGLILFLFQFLWQFPHFWSIAWLLKEDYDKAGFKMLPTEGGHSRKSSFFILLYGFLLVPLSFLSYSVSFSSFWGALFLGIAGLGFFIPAFRLHISQDKKFARKLMFASFLYLPLIQIIFLIDAYFHWI